MCNLDSKRIAEIIDIYYNDDYSWGGINTTVENDPDEGVGNGILTGWE